MAWNGSDQGKAVGAGVPPARSNKKGGKYHASTSTSNFNYKALCAGLIVVALGCAGVW